MTHTHANNSVRVAKRPIALTAPADRPTVTSCLKDEYTPKNNYRELTALKFRRPTAMLSWNATQTGRADSTAPWHANMGHDL